MPPEPEEDQPEQDEPEQDVVVTEVGAVPDANAGRDHLDVDASGEAGPAVLDGPVIDRRHKTSPRRPDHPPPGFHI